MIMLHHKPQDLLTPFLDVRGLLCKESACYVRGHNFIDGEDVVSCLLCNSQLHLACMVKLLKDKRLQPHLLAGEGVLCAVCLSLRWPNVVYLSTSIDLPSILLLPSSALQLQVGELVTNAYNTASEQTYEIAVSTF